MSKWSKLAQGVMMGGLVVAMLVNDADAATSTANLNVTATVGANCSISTTALAFGAYDPIGTHSAAPLNGTGSVVVTCTNGASSTLTLGQGSHANTGSSDAAPLRRLQDSGSNVLTYSLYQDSGRNTVWGNTALTGVSHTGTGSATSVTVYGQIAAGQNVPAGNYSDVVVATVTF